MAAHPRRFCWLLLPAVTCAAPSGPSHIGWDGGVPFDLQDFPNQKQRRRARCRVACFIVCGCHPVGLPTEVAVTHNRVASPDELIFQRQGNSIVHRNFFLTQISLRII